ncbi:hypothetical protein OHB13_12000 [Streptomyces sp. NBC_00440]|uniref:hypothetical protein n=1 Tax=Streptomyces sp. NBC_00440 TaxID=2975741 RepID=UPI002E24EC6C
MGTVRSGKKPSQEYTLIWRNIRTGETASETHTEKLSTLKNYIFKRGMDYNFSGAGHVLDAEIWRTYKNLSKRVH